MCLPAALPAAVSSFVGANATSIAVGSALLSAAGTEYAARQAGKAQKRALEANARGVALDAAGQYGARSLALQNEQEAVAVERERLARETRTLVGTQALASVEAGVGGASVDELIADFETLGAYNERNLQRNLELSTANFAAETRSIFTRADNQIEAYRQTAISQPSLTRFMLNFGVGALDGITRYAAPNPIR